MRKRIITFLLTGAMLFGALPNGIYAEPISVEESIAEDTFSDTEDADAEETFTDTEAADEIDISELSFSKPGGLIQPQIYEVEDPSLLEVYEEEVDRTSKGSAVYRYDWDKYSTNYYYNQLPESCQEFWDDLDVMCLGYLTGTEAVSAANAYRTKSIVFSDIEVSKAVDIANMFKWSNPQYYFLDNSLYWSGVGTNGMLSFTIFPAFANGAARSQATAQMKSIIDSWMAQINAQPNALAKEKLAHDLICEKVEYDPGYENRAIPMNPYNQVAYSVFCTDSTVCAGYSQAMQLLMNGVGIDCAVVTSTEHEWNIIRLNNTWYCVDLTWDDLSAQEAAAVGQGMMYAYFNRNEQIFIHDAQWGSEHHIAEPMWNGYLPPLTYDSGATVKDIGTIYSPAVSLGQPQISCSGSTVTMSAPSGGTIYYTLNGISPSVASTRAKKYTGPFSLSGAAFTVRAVAVNNGCFDSSISALTVTPRYSVSFQANGGYIGQKSVTQSAQTGLPYGTKLGIPQDPKRKGYAFLGWYTAKSGGTILKGTEAVTADMVIYAHWAKINPKKATVKTLKNNSSKAMKVTIKNMKTANGYQIRYSANKNMSSAKSKTVTENTAVIKKLKKGKTYYVQVRMYQKESVSGKKKYGSWSKVKSVKIKK